MRFHFLLFTLVSVAYSAELNTQLLSLIGEDAIVAYGTDLDRYQGSLLAQLIPVNAPLPGILETGPTASLSFDISDQSLRKILEQQARSNAVSGR